MTTKRKYSTRPSKYLTQEQIKIAEENGITRTTWIRRLKDLKWDVERAITEKPRKRGDWNTRLYTLYKGDDILASGTVFEIAERLGRSVSSVKYITYPAYRRKVENQTWETWQVMEYIGEVGEEDE